MKKLILSTIVLLMAGLSSAYAQDEAIAQEPTTEGVIQPYLRSCDSPYLGHNESCMSSTNSCPGGYEFDHANYCCDHNGNFYRCGTICKSIYSGGH